MNKKQESLPRLSALPLTVRVTMAEMFPAVNYSNSFLTRMLYANLENRARGN